MDQISGKYVFVNFVVFFLKYLLVTVKYTKTEGADTHDWILSSPWGLIQG